jgi:hypothetical protein
MNDTKQAATPIDAVQLAALRKCTDVVFSHFKGESSIRAIKRKRACAADPFAGDVEMTVACETRWNDYATDCGISWPVPSFRGFEMFGNYEDSAWRTIASLLKVGDVLTLEWSRDAASHETMRKLGLHGDRLRLLVVRGKARLWFELATSICPDNTARMIRDVRPVEYSIT